MTSPFLKGDYSNLLTLSIVGEPSWSWIPKKSIQVQKGKEKFVVVCLRSPQNLKVGNFTLQSCSDGKEVYQKAWCTCKVVVLLIFFFWCSRCRRPFFILRLMTVAPDFTTVHFNFMPCTYKLERIDFNNKWILNLFTVWQWRRLWTDRPSLLHALGRSQGICDSFHLTSYYGKSEKKNLLDCITIRVIGGRTRKGRTRNPSKPLRIPLLRQKDDNTPQVR